MSNQKPVVELSLIVLVSGNGVAGGSTHDPCWIDSSVHTGKQVLFGAPKQVLFGAHQCREMLLLLTKHKLDALVGAYLDCRAQV